MQLCKCNCGSLSSFFIEAGYVFVFLKKRPLQIYELKSGHLGQFGAHP